MTRWFDRPIRRRPDRLVFRGRVLFLTEDPALIRRQLEGEDLPWDPSIKLRDDISTDEITPAHICYYYDERIADYVYTGLKAGGEFPIRPGDVRQGGFVASVSGKRRGKGSSREHSPFAEMNAGIQVVLAENIERIYNQNCQNLGLLTSTNFDLIEDIRRGRPIPLSAFTEGTDPITRQVIEYGGLFGFNVARFQGLAYVPPIRTPRRPMTLAEKIIARHMRVDAVRDVVGVPAVRPGDAGFVVADWRFSHEYVTPMAAIYLERLVGPDARVTDPDSILCFRDHLTYLDLVMPEEKRRMGLLDLAYELKVRQEEFCRKQGIRLHGELPDRRGSEAICHSIMLETYALPGQVVVGTDSHTTHIGAIGCFAFGIGTTDIFNAWITKDVRVRVPETVLVRIEGSKPRGVTAKDIVLAILRHPFVKSGQAIGKVIEFDGEAVRAMSVDERATLTNMTAEIGGFTGIVAPDEKTVEFLVERRGMARSEAERLCEGLFSDPGAEYAEVLTFRADELRPLVARPGDPGNGIFIDELPGEVQVDIAYGGSCTGGKAEDMDMYALVLYEALEQGRRVHPRVRFYIQFGSQEVRRYCERRGYLKIFEAAGAILLEPSCGACINAGPGASTSPDQVTISAQNRNFPGRSGPGQVYLASPLTVAASAVAGRVTEYRPLHVECVERFLHHRGELP
ncbi:3-isopropylmalate dehydratase large subunit [bacterium HR11]|nr:3-isopropylmalate dehydratase large subunit [bacterium HR11]